MYNFLLLVLILVLPRFGFLMMFEKWLIEGLVGLERVGIEIFEGVLLLVLLPAVDQLSGLMI